MVITKGLYHSYTSISQFYSTVKSIINSIDTFNKLFVVIKLDITAKLAAELVDAIIVAKCYIGSIAFLCYTGNITPPRIANYHQ